MLANKRLVKMNERLRRARLDSRMKNKIPYYLRNRYQNVALHICVFNLSLQSTIVVEFWF